MTLGRRAGAAGEQAGQQCTSTASGSYRLHHALAAVAVKQEEVVERLVLLADGFDDLLSQDAADDSAHRTQLPQTPTVGRTDGNGQTWPAHRTQLPHTPTVGRTDGNGPLL